MKVVRLHGVSDLRMHDEPEPSPDRGEALLRVTAVGICGSDLDWFSEASIGDAEITKPLVLGHEFAAEIVEGDRRGERVAVDPAIPCGECDRCREGNPNLCPLVSFAGFGEFDGAMREHICWPEPCLYTLPYTISDLEGVMLEPLGVALHSVSLSNLKPGMSVGVYGCGPIGLLIIQLARIMGATQIIATDKLTHRLQAAEVYGASDSFLAQNGQEQKDVLAATGDEGVDVAFEVAGENEAVETAIETARPGARVVLIGIPSDDWTQFRASSARRKGLTIMICRRMKHTYPRSIQLVERGLVEVASLVTHTFEIGEYEQAFATAARREGIKIVIKP